MNEDEARRLGRAFAEGLIETILGRASRAPIRETQESTTAQGEPRWMKINDYAKRRGFARSTVQQWIAEGMPATPMGRGYRVDVRAADAWLEGGGAARCVRQDA